MGIKANKLTELFEKIDEPYAAGFFENPERSRFFRLARAQRRYWEKVPLPAFTGGRLYPAGPRFPKQYGVRPDYSSTFYVDAGILEEKSADGLAIMQEEANLVPDISQSTVHTVGGAGYTHSIPHYGRVAREGLNRYRERVLAGEPGEFRDGLLELLDGIEYYRSRCLQLLREVNAPKALIDALERVPFDPAKTLYEALVCWNFVYYLDGCDNPGLLDADLMPFYQGENVEAVLREFFSNVDCNDGWSCAIGPDYSPMTLQCLHAIRGLRRPSMELRVTKDMPLEIWKAAIAALKTGCGQPAFYSEEGFQESLAHRFPQIPKQDLLRFNGGGCSETMLAGMTNAGSLDAGVNLLRIFSDYLRGPGKQAQDFDAFYKGFLSRTAFEVDDTLEKVSQYRQRRAEFRPQPVRTLLIDDCIDRGIDYNAGGARYCWSVINLAGLINVIDSLLVVREVVFVRETLTLPELIEALDSEDAALLSAMRSCPCFGRDDEYADSLAEEFTRWLLDRMETAPPPAVGLGYLPASIQFATYVGAGIGIPATPDGRRANAPLADSIGAILGKDIYGPTAMMNSAARLNQLKMPGTPVLNIRLQKGFLDKALRSLILGYFEKGGLQVQITCLSAEEIRAAMAHPEEHENLIVRIGGYSEYFNRLGPELQQTVLERTEFGG